MNKQTGIWIDSSKAMIVVLQDGEKQLNVLPSGIVPRVREPGEGKSFGRFGNQFLNMEKQKEGRYENEVREYLQSVIKAIPENGPVVLFGPAQMKNELSKAMKMSSPLGERLTGIVTADSMTDNQVVAWVVDYFKTNK